MKPTAYLINVARGPVIKQDVLLKALKEGWIAGASFLMLSFARYALGHTSTYRSA